MAKTRRSLIIIPPKKDRTIYIRIHFGVLLFAILLAAFSFIGFFIPSESMSLTGEEINQRRNIAEQNNKLIKKIRQMQTLLVSLNNELEALNSRKRGIEKLLDIQQDDKIKTSKTDTLFSSGDIDLILQYAETQDNFLNHFLTSVEKTPDILHSVPVLLPIDAKPVISARFGDMKDPFTGSMKRHDGVDLSCDLGTAVFAPAHGIVEAVETSAFWGKKLVLRHKYGFKTVFAHLENVDVPRGRAVKKGDRIGTVGISGLTTGPRLHYEIIQHDEHIDPEILLFGIDSTAFALTLSPER